MPFTAYSGPSANFPPQSQWKSFEEIFNVNKSEMLATGSTNDDVNHIYNAVVQCADLGVEDRIIFCIIMQESTGNVGVRTTVNADGHGTAGLMQADGSPGFPGQHGLSQVGFPPLKSRIGGQLTKLTGSNNIHGSCWYSTLQGKLAGVWRRLQRRHSLQGPPSLQLWLS